MVFARKSTLFSFHSPNNGNYQSCRCTNTDSHRIHRFFSTCFSLGSSGRDVPTGICSVALTSIFSIKHKVPESAYAMRGTVRHFLVVYFCI